MNNIIKRIKELEVKFCPAKDCDCHERLDEFKYLVELGFKEILERLDD